MDCPHCVRRLGGPAAAPYRRAPPLEAKIALVPERHASGATIERCPSCRGAFASHEAMKTVDTFGYDTRKRTSTLEIMRRASAGPVPRITCPSCAGETTRREWSFATLVMVDVCIECRGVWMDGGELEAIDGTAQG
jgi:Zn-finger nucleic acid-binding protein